jgi:uncharacterized protein YciI
MSVWQFEIRLFPHRGLALLKAPTAEERAIMAAHRKYMETLAEGGQLVLTGVSEGSTEVDGLVIVNADSEDAARAIVERDPFVRGGLVRAEVRPFRTVLIRA